MSQGTPPNHNASSNPPPKGSFIPVTHERPLAASTPSSTPLPSRPPPLPPAARSNRLVTGSLIALVTVFFVFPFGYITYHNNKADRAGHYSSKTPMTRQAAIRGAYMNTGSNDVGYDDEFYKRNAEVVRQYAEAQSGGQTNIAHDTKR